MAGTIRTVLSASGGVAHARYPLELFCLSGFVAESQSGREGRGVVGGRGPDVADRVTDRRVDGERPVAEDTLHGGNHHGVDSPFPLRGRHGLGWFPLLRRFTILSDALWMGHTCQSSTSHKTCPNVLDTQSS